MTEFSYGGYVPDGVENVEWEPAVGLASVASLPASVDLSHLDSVRNQRTANMCVGCAFAGAIELRGRALGHLPRLLSEQALWTYARQVDSARDGLSRELFDRGARPSSAVAAMSVVGLVPQELWPFDLAKVNHMPPWDVVAEGYDMRFAGAKRIVELGPERAAAVRAALANGYPVAFATKVCSVYEAGTFGVYPGLVGEERGWHYQAIVGYDVGKFKVLNSWGPEWADAGHCWMADSVVASGQCQDFYLIQTEAT